MSRQKVDVSQLSPEERALLRAEAMRRALAIVDRYAPPLLFLLAFATRLFAATAISFPALDDPAYYLKVAENLAIGRGLTIDAIWGYLVPVNAVGHASNEHWMPLASLVLAPFFAAFGPGFPLAQTVGAGVGALLAPLGWVLTRQILAEQERWRGYALFTGVFLAFNPLLIYQAVTGDSAVWFAVLGTLLAVLGSGVALRTNAGALLTGGVAGLAYLARTEGLLLAAVLLAWLWLRTEQPARLRRTLLCLAGVLVMAAPWWLRNSLTFSSPIPVPSLLLAAIPDYAALFHYPGPEAAPFPTAGFGEQVALRLEGFGANLAVLLRGLFPAAPLALVGGARLWATPALRLHLAITGALFITTALVFPVLTINGTFYHAAGATLPALALLSGYGLFVTARALARRFAPNTAALFGQLLCAGAVVLQLFQLGTALDLTSEGHQAWQRKFAVAAEWLASQPEGTPVLTNQPNSLHYATGRPTIMVPLPDPPATARAVAQRYGATHLVAFWGLGPFGASSRYPDALKDASAGFEEVYARDGVTVYRIR